MRKIGRALELLGLVLLLWLIAMAVIVGASATPDPCCCDQQVYCCEFRPADNGTPSKRRLPMGKEPPLHGRWRRPAAAVSRRASR